MSESLSENLQSRYRLRADPFSLLSGFYYSTPAHESCVNALVHFAHFGNMVLMVTGERGIGKSTLLQRFRLDVGEALRMCVLDSALMMGEAQLVDRLLSMVDLKDEDFLAVGASETPEDRLDIFFAACKRRMLFEPRLLILVDDAHDLSEEAFRLLLSRALANPPEESGVVLLFSALPELTALANRVQSSSPVEALIHQVELLPFNKAESIEYVRSRMIMAGAQKDLKFSSGLSDQLFLLGKGNPRRIAQIAAGVLLGDADKSVSRNRVQMLLDITGYRYFYHTLVTVGAVLAFSIALVQSMYSESPGTGIKPDGSGAEYEGESLSGKEAVLEIQKRLEKIESSVSGSRQEKSNLEVKAEVLDGGGLPIVPVQAVASSISSTSTEGNNAGSPEISSSQGADIEGASGKSGPAKAAPVIAKVQSDKLLKQNTVSDLDDMSGLDDKPSQESRPKKESALRQDNGAQKMVNAPPSRERKSDPAVEGRSQYYRGDGWVKELPEQGYIVQLLGSYNEATAIKFVTQYNALQFVYIESSLKGKPWFIVLTEGFANRSDARDAVSKMPAAIVKQKPWIRKVSAIR
ncbi:AAA family ATPase [Oleiphilus messinensis]|uniref:AAA family ATPase n=1 Tax=Oleiphilus messinensis TaxID=141451 RepID=UPI0018E017E0|nr:AAA family ATPase [Oleiphilus messinensis]